MKVGSLSRWVSAAALMTALVLVFACSSSGPAGPTSLGKGVYRGTVTDASDNVVFDAEIFVDGEETGVLTDVNGEFQVELTSGPHLLTATKDGVEVWRDEVFIEEEEEEGGEGDLLVEEEEVSNGIGPCVSECTHIYNPSKYDSDADDLTGNFNARYCVEFCKGSDYRGGASKYPDGECNPFYEDYDEDCTDDVEPPKEPVEILADEDPEGEAEGEGNKKPRKNGK